MVHAGLAIKSAKVRLGGEADKIAVSRLILGQENQVVRSRVNARLLVERSVGNVDLAANDWLDANLLSLAVKLDCPKHGAVVGQGKRGHPEVRGGVQEVIDACQAIEQ
jgi:hypothetical protein